jgi:Tol biopolymer transport system component/tRNA A-37 threonylcarbamoyl transferase component Bud32
MQAERGKQIEELYQAALAQPAEKRAAFLAQARPDDPQLRGEVQSMLDRQLDTFLESAPVSAIKALSAGAKLGNFEILELLGRGGMGEVWKARDARLHRIVAIKILPPRLAGSAESRDRFEREARMIASFNHPHICTLHDVGHHGEVDYLVMEFLEGETLAARLIKGPLPLEQTLQYAIQIAGALGKAHRGGMTHRDLKPGNIMLTKSGAKLLDFGLAKLKQGASAVGVPLSQLPTAEDPITAQGTIVGTPQYMAPEQLEGRETDARTDIFALGAVIYEMATGKKAFEGKSQASTIAKILETDPPPIRSLQPTTPAALDRVVRTCLAKDPDNRLQSAQDAKLELEWIRDAVAEPSALGSAAPLAGWRRALPWALFAAAALVFAVFAWVHQTGAKNAVPPEPVRLQIPLPMKPPLRLSGLLALSPDGQQLAFAATGADGIPRIWVRALNSLKIRPLPGTESAGTLLFWSPDSRFVAFDAGGKLQKIEISGGPAETVCVLNMMGVGGSWNRDGVIVFGQFGGTLMRVSAAGGVATPLTALDAPHGDVAHTVPWFLPDGRHFIYLRDTGTSGVISAGSLDVKPEEQDSRRLVEAGNGLAYIPSSDPGFGQLLFLRGETLMAQPFDARHLNLSGDPVRVVEEPVGAFLDSGLFSVSINGTLAYWSPGSVESQLTWFDAQGKVLSTMGKPGPYVAVALSPDGTRAFVSRYTLPDQRLALWLLDISRGTSTRFELDPSADNQAAVWAPDGRSIIFASCRAGQSLDIYEKQMSGAAEARALIKSNDWKTPLSWSPDGRFLLYATMGGKTNGDLWVLPLEGRQKPVPFLRTEFDEGDGRFSPDGRWVAYVSNESGRYEVYVRPFSPDALGEGISNAGGKWLISENGGYNPIWRQDGKELYYIDPDGKLMAVKLTPGSVFQAGVPRVLFQAPPGGLDSQGLTQWAPSPDGKRFLFLVPETQGGVPFTVVLNWQAGLKK